MGVRAWFVVGGLVTLAAGIGGCFIPSLRNIERQKEQPQITQITQISSQYPAES